MRNLYTVWSRRSWLWLDCFGTSDLRRSGLVAMVGGKGSVRARRGVDAVSLERLFADLAVPPHWRTDAVVRTRQCRPALPPAGHDLLCFHRPLSAQASLQPPSRFGWLCPVV